MDMPPSRYKVVEEGRRLVVIDRMTGETMRPRVPGRPSGRGAVSPPPPPPASAPPRPAQAGEPVITTQRWFDDKGPRTLALRSDASMTLVIAALVLVVALTFLFAWTGMFGVIAIAVIAFNKATLPALRKGMTVWLDSLEKV